MIKPKMIAVIAIVCAAASLINAATIPAETILAVTTVSLYYLARCRGQHLRSEDCPGRFWQGQRYVESRNKSISGRFTLLVVIRASPRDFLWS